MSELESLFQETRFFSSRAETMQAFLKLGKDAGFDMACFLELQSDFHRHGLDTMPLVNSFPDDFVEAYISQNFLAIDPVVECAFHRVMPYRWRQVGELKPLTPGETHYLQQLDDAGIVDGVAVPLFGPNGTIGFAGFGMQRGRVDLTHEEMLMLQHKAFHLYTTYLDQGDQPIQPHLSPREREVLSWVAAGKSNTVIADILKISDHTVDSLLRRAYRKLNVTTRTAAVIRAVQWGLIGIS